MAYISEIEVTRNRIFPPPGIACVCWEFGNGERREIPLPVSPAIAYETAKNWLAAGCRVWYKGIITNDGVGNV